MSIRTDARQRKLTAIVDIVPADLPNGSPVVALDLPQGSVVTDLVLIVDALFNDTGAATLDIGDNTDPDRYTASPINIDTTGGALGIQSGVAVTGFETTSAEPQIWLTAAGNFDATAGALRLLVEYVEVGRHDENFGDGLEFQGPPA